MANPSSGELAREIALGWIGTPYVHQASAKGKGCDCLGLLRGVWRELYGAEPEQMPHYTPDWSETDGIERLLAAARRHMTPKPLTAGAVGDVLLFRLRARSVAKHVGILMQTGPVPRFVHSYSGMGVVVSPLSRPWARRMAGVFSLPAVPARTAFTE